MDLQAVRFKVCHPGMGADVGHVLWVPKEWAAIAIPAGIVEAVDTPPEPLPPSTSPGWVGRQDD